MRSAIFVDAHRSAGEDDCLGASADDLLPRCVEGNELGIDVQLADPARDELRRLSAEIKDEDRVGRLRVCVRCSIRRRSVERYLKVGLDLGIVRSEDAVAGVRLLTVDCLAALRTCDVRSLRAVNASLTGCHHVIA